MRPMKLSVSRSVSRAFAVMEAFRECRQPASATDLSRRLDVPHSSMVAVLYNLRDLGYLRFDSEHKTFFPTAKLAEIGGWLRGDRQEHRLGLLADQVARDTGHMTVLSSRLSLFVNTLMLREGRFPAVSGPSRAVGGVLSASVAGPVILAQMADDEIRGLLRDIDAWLRDAGAGRPADSDATLARIETIRAKGFLVGGHPSCRGTEIMAFPLAGAAADAPCALALHVPVLLARDSKADLLQRVGRRLRESAATGRAPGAATAHRPAPRPCRMEAGPGPFVPGFPPPVAARMAGLQAPRREA